MTEIVGTAVKDESKGMVSLTEVRALDEEGRAKIDQANALIRQAYDLIGEVFTHVMPVGRVQWIHASQVQANDYNPNSVAHQEMKLLHTSIASDGYTQPVVAIFDPEAAGGEGRNIIVDGYHRYTVMRKYSDIADMTAGYLPVVILDKSPADRIASTVRHNRARGKHSVAGMGNLVFQMLAEGESDEDICNKLGLEAEELSRLKHITGYSKLYADAEYSPVILTKTQLDEKAAWKRDHPEEKVPKF